MSATATQADLDAIAYNMYELCNRNKAETGRRLSLSASTVSDRIKRHQARAAQDEAGEPETAEDPSESVTALLEDGEPAQPAAPILGIPYAWTDPDTGAMTCPVCSAVFAEDYDATGERLTEFYGAHYAQAHAEPAPAPAVSSSDVTAQPGPGQAADNIVHQTACGHEYDNPAELAPGTVVVCSAHGPTSIVGSLDNMPAAQLAPAGNALRKLHETVYPEKYAATPESAPAAQPVKAGRFPEGVVKPYEFRALMVAEGLVPERSVKYLAYKLASEEPTFPARWYFKDGTASDGKEPGTRLGVDLAAGRAWIQDRPAKPARQPRVAKGQPVLWADGKPAERLVALLGGAELAGADVSALFAAYADQSGGIRNLPGFICWLAGIG